MKLSTGSLAGASARHPWRVIAWLGVTVLAIVVLVTLLGGSLTTEGAPTNNPESERADDALEAAFPPDPSTNVTDIVVVRSEEQTVDSPRFAAFVRAFVDDAEIAALGHARTYPDDRGESLVSEDRHATIIPLTLFDDEDQTEALVEKVEAAAEDGAFAVTVTGTETLDHGNDSSGGRTSRPADDQGIPGPPMK